MQRSYSMRDAYKSIYEKKESLREPTIVEDVIDSLVEGGLLREEEKMSAMDMVRKQITDKYGKGALVDTKAPKKKETDEEKAQKAKNYAANRKKDDPYKARAGESD